MPISLGSQAIIDVQGVKNERIVYELNPIELEQAVQKWRASQPKGAQ